MDHKRLYYIPVDEKRVANRLHLLFDINAVHSFTSVVGGHMCRNFRVDTDKGVFFLKQYRNQISSVIHEIKNSESFFAKHNLPVIEPIKDKFSRPVFWLDGHWLSLFPFIDGSSPEYGKFSHTTVGALGYTLGRFHRAGSLANYEYVQPLRLGYRSKFLMEAIELQFELRSLPHPTMLEERILQILEHKRKWVLSNRLPPREIALPFDCLLHGDFIYPNVFVDDEGRITHIYDFEKTCQGPRAYEFARSLIINCFDDGWSEQNFSLAGTFLRSYRDVQDLNNIQLVKGIRMYAHDLMHMTWIEAKYVIYGMKQQMALYERHANRVEWMSENLNEFCRRIESL